MVNNTIKGLIAVGILVAALCGYYMYKAGGDVTLAKAVMSYELKEFFGGLAPQSSTADEYAELAVDEQPQATSKDTMYQDGNRYSDYKKQGSDEQVEVRANP